MTMKAWTRGSLGAAFIVATVAAATAGAYILHPSARAPHLAAPTRAAAPGLIRLDGPEGTRLLFESEAYAAFLPLVSHFETQASLTHCGPASIAMVLNALELPAPAAAAYGSYRIFTQRNVLNPLTDPIITQRAVERRGMSLADVAEVLAAYGASVEIYYAGTSDAAAFRQLAVSYMGSPRSHVIVNYGRTALGQEGPGHISPLGAYDADSDRFLILDVSRYKSPAVWVPAEHLFLAMAEPLDPGSVRTRGFLLVRPPADTGVRSRPACSEACPRTKEPDLVPNLVPAVPG